MSGFPFFFQEQTLYFGLSSDSRVIGTRYPQGAVTFHAVVAHDQVFDSNHAGTAGMEGASDIGRRENDTKWESIFFRHPFFDTDIRVEKATFFPALVEFFFPFGGGIGFGDFFFHKAYGITENASFQCLLKTPDLLA